MATEKKTERKSMKSSKAAPKGLKKTTSLGGGAGEICYGCGLEIPIRLHALLPPTSVVGVINEKDLDDGWTMIDNPSSDTAPDGEHYVGVPVCLSCHRDPQHRTVHPLKMHFFERQGNIPKMALIMAGSTDLGG